MSRSLETNKTLYLARAAIIAALYAALTLAFPGLSYGAVQFRFSEAFTVLPFFLPEAVPGLFVGCVIANVFSSVGWIDIVVGSVATLTAALLTTKVKRIWLAPLPAVIINAFLVGTMLTIVFGGKDTVVALATYNILTVGLGEAVVCYGLGLPLLLLFEKNKTLNRIIKK